MKDEQADDVVVIAGGGPQYARTPRALLESTLGTTERAVFAALALSADADGHIPEEFTPTQKDLARRSGVAKRQTVAAALERLRDGGWIAFTTSQVRGPGGRWVTVSSYDLSPAWDREDDARRARNRKRSRVRSGDTDRVRLADVTGSVERTPIQTYVKPSRPTPPDRGSGRHPQAAASHLAAMNAARARAGQDPLTELPEEER